MSLTNALSAVATGVGESQPSSNSNWLHDLVIAVIGGLVLNGISWLWVTTLLPIYRNSVYKGVKIHGDWCYDQDEKATDGEGFLVTGTWRVTLSQKAHVITGEAQVSRNSVGKNPPAEVFRYDVNGHIYDRFVSITMRGQDTNHTAHSTFLLEVRNGGNTLKGYRNFYGMNKNTIRSVQCSWTKHGAIKCESKTEAAIPEPSN